MKNTILNIFAFCAFFTCDNCSCGPATSRISRINLIVNSVINYQTPLIKNDICNDESTKSKIQNEFIVKTRLTVIIPGGYDTDVKISTDDQVFWDRMKDTYGTIISNKSLREKHSMEVDFIGKENSNVDIEITQKVGSEELIYPINNENNKKYVSDNSIRCYLYSYPTMKIYRMFVIIDPKNDMAPESNESIFGSTLLSVYNDICNIDMNSHSCVEGFDDICDNKELAKYLKKGEKKYVISNEEKISYNNFRKSLHLESPLIRVDPIGAFSMKLHKCQTKYSIIHTFAEFEKNYHTKLIECIQEPKK